MNKRNRIINNKTTVSVIIKIEAASAAINTLTSLVIFFSIKDEFFSKKFS